MIDEIGRRKLYEKMYDTARRFGAFDQLRAVASIEKAVFGGRNIQEVIAELKRNQPRLFRSEK